MEKFELGNTGIDPLIRTENDRILGRFGHLNKLVNAITALQETPPGSGLQSVVAGTGITVDDLDPLNPIVNADIINGSYVPTFTVQTEDFTSAVIGGTSWYNKTGNFVQLFFKLRIEFNAERRAEFSMTLPFSSNLTSFDAIAICNLIEPQTNGGAVIKNNNNGNTDSIEFQFETENSSSDTYEFNVIVNYAII